MKINKLFKRIEKRKRKIRVRWGNDLEKKVTQKNNVLQQLTDPTEKQNAEYLFSEMIDTVKKILGDFQNPQPYLIKKYEKLYNEAVREIKGKTNTMIEMDHELTLAFNRSLMYAQVKEELEVLL